MYYELRRYEVEPGKLDAFADAWLAGVLPLRRLFGFEIHSTWAVPDTNEFVWIIGHEDESAFRSANDAYYASEARSSLDPDPAQWIRRAHESRAERIA